MIRRNARQLGDESMGRITVEIDIANNRDVGLAEAGVIKPEEVRRARLQGVVDSGAAMLVLPASIVKQLGFPDAGYVKVRYADQRVIKRKQVSNVLVALRGREADFLATVEPKRDTALIGAIVLEALDLVVDCRNQRLEPRDPEGIVAEIE